MKEVRLELGDCFELIKSQPDNSVDLVITSPPYSDIVNYGKDVSIKKPKDYVDWLLPLFDEIQRVLKPSGSFILNINDNVSKGIRNYYIYELIYRSQTETKLKLYDTYFWHKKNGIPNGSKKRFRNMTEFIFHFCKNPKEMKFYMDRVLQEPAESYKNRFKYKDSIAGQGITKNGIRYVEKGLSGELKKVRPDNVVRFNTNGTSRDNTIKHPAPFNIELPLYYINLLTDEGDVVLDPFSGIGTTGMGCKELNRKYIGYELNETYYDFSISRLNGVEGDTYVVSQYTMEDEYIKSYPNRSSAGKELDLCEEDIMRCYRGNRKSVGGYKFKLEKIRGL